MIEEEIFRTFNIGAELSGEEAKKFISHVFAELLKNQKNKEEITAEDLYKGLNKFISIKIKKID